MKRIISVLLCVLLVFSMCSCGSSSGKIDGKKIELDGEVKNHYITYKYPSAMKEADTGNDQKKQYEYYNDKGELKFILKVETYSLILSFAPMEEDAQKLLDDTSNKNINDSTVKVNKHNMAMFSFTRDDEFGSDTLYHVYYAGYSYMGVSKYFKIWFINVEGNDSFEKAFLSNFKIND